MGAPTSDPVTSHAVTGRNSGEQRRHRLASLLLVALVLPLFVSLAASACAKDGELSEVNGGAAADNGPKPTAPPLGNDNAANGSGQAGLTGSVDANELIRRIDDLTSETDLC